MGICFEEERGLFEVGLGGWEVRHFLLFLGSGIWISLDGVSWQDFRGREGVLE